MFGDRRLRREDSATATLPEQSERIAEAARELDRLRTGWLNPPEWTREEVLEFPGSVHGPWARYVHGARRGSPDVS